MSEDILLESGTNEVEILEFYLGKQSYGINVAKVLQIELYNPEMVTRTPGSGEDGVLGIYLWRGETVSFLDLAIVLNMPKTEELDRPIVLVTEFNGLKNAFLVDGVNQVYRVSWTQMAPVSNFITKYSPRTNATLHVEYETESSKETADILMLDFESIVGEYCPEAKMGYGKVEMPLDRECLNRENVKIVVAEDSAFLREVMVRTLHDANYDNLEVFENGQQAFDYVAGLKTDEKKQGLRLSDRLNLIITDIEMPLMDGLTLCRRVKTDLGLTQIPVIFFSSLITEQMKLKCQEVGGEAQITKPEIGQLVGIIDDLCTVSG